MRAGPNGPERRRDQNPVALDDPAGSGGCRVQLDHRIWLYPPQAAEVAVLAMTIDRALRRGQREREAFAQPWSGRTKNRKRRFADRLQPCRIDLEFSRGC